MVWLLPYTELMTVLKDKKVDFVETSEDEDFPDVRIIRVKADDNSATHVYICDSNQLVEDKMKIIDISDDRKVLTLFNEQLNCILETDAVFCKLA
jgi:hypothetical protein